MGNLIAVVAIVLILGSSIGYIVKAKKSGVHCIGCPAGSSCSGHCSTSESAVEKQEVISECGCSTGGTCNCGDDSSCNCGGNS